MAEKIARKQIKYVEQQIKLVPHIPDWIFVAPNIKCKLIIIIVYYIGQEIII